MNETFFTEHFSHCSHYLSFVVVVVCTNLFFIFFLFFFAYFKTLFACKREKKKEPLMSNATATITATVPDPTLEFSERWAGVAFLECIVLGFFVVKVMINRFISFEGTPFFIYLTIFLGYFLSASIVFLIPVDISNVKKKTRKILFYALL